MRLMWDSTSAADIPADAGMVAGYLDGTWAWSAADWARFPNAIKIRIACFAATAGADVYDVEKGDVTPAQCPAVWQRERAAGREPIAYGNRSTLPQVRLAFVSAGMRSPRFWEATLDNRQPWGPGIIAIQYAGEAITGRHYDLSDVSDQWPGLAPAGGGNPMTVEERLTYLEQQVASFNSTVPDLVNQVASFNTTVPLTYNQLQTLKVQVAQLQAATGGKPSAPFDATITPK